MPTWTLRPQTSVNPSDFNTLIAVVSAAVKRNGLNPDTLAAAPSGCLIALYFMTVPDQFNAIADAALQNPPTWQAMQAGDTAGMVSGLAALFALAADGLPDVPTVPQAQAYAAAIIKAAAAHDTSPIVLLPPAPSSGLTLGKAVAGAVALGLVIWGVREVTA